MFDDSSIDGENRMPSYFESTLLSYGQRKSQTICMLPPLQGSSNAHLNSSRTLQTNNEICHLRLIDEMNGIYKFIIFAVFVYGLSTVASSLIVFQSVEYTYT